MQRVQASDIWSKGHRILIVEDDLIMKPVLEEIVFRACAGKSAFIRWAYSKEGADGLLAKAKGEGYSFDLIISDLMLSGEQNGLDLWKQVQFSAKSAFLLISSCKDRQIQQLAKCLEAGLPNCLHKPLDIEKTTKLVRSLLSRPHEGVK